LSHKERISKIILRAEGNPSIGLGHIYRLFSLGQMVEGKYSATFVSHSDVSHILSGSTIEQYQMPTDLSLQEEPNWLKSNFSSDEYIVVVDGYDFSDEYFKQLKTAGYKTVYLDDFIRNVEVDIIVNLALGIDPSSYSTNPNQRVLTGTKFALLRPEFSRPIKEVKKDSCLIAFGATDIAQLGAKAVQACLNVDQFEEIHVITGHAHSQELTELAEVNKSVKLHYNLSASDLVDIMDGCNIAFCSPSGIAYELCSRRVPFFVGYYADNQVLFHDGLVKGLLGLHMGDITQHTVSHFEEELENHDRYHTADQISAQEKHFDHKSADRWVQILDSLVSGLTIRPCDMNDVDAVFEMANDPIVRNSSYHSEKITYDVHVNWFKSKLDNPDSFLYSLEMGKEMAGFVRFDIDGEHAVIGLIVMEAFRGQRLASPMLVIACEKFHESHRLPILAYIKKSNMVSSKSFKRANFEFVRDEIIEDHPSAVFTLLP